MSKYICVLAIWSIFAGFSSVAYSAPTLVSKWKPIVLTSSGGTRYLRDDVDEKTIWVLPPSMGQVDVGDAPISHHPNHKRCPQLRQSFEDVLANSGEFDRSLGELYRYTSELDELNKGYSRLRKAQLEAASSAKDRDLADRLLQYLNAINSVKLGLVDITHRVDACRNSCQQLFGLKLSAERELEAHSISFDRLALKDVELAKNLQNQSSEILGYLVSAYENKRTTDVVIKHMQKAEKRLFKTYSAKALLPGGDRVVQYKLNWQKKISDIARANPRINVKAIPLRSLRLRSRLVPEKIDHFYLATLPIFIGFRGQNELLAKDGEVEVGGPFQVKAMNVLTAKYTFSLGGVCPLVSPQYFQSISKMVRLADNNRPSYGAILTYSFLVKIPKKIKAMFDPYAIFKEIKSKVSLAGHIHKSDLLKKLDSGKFNKMVKISDESDMALKRLLVEEAVYRVLAAASIPVSRVAFESKSINSGHIRQSSKHCGSYACELAGWDLIPGIEIYGNRSSRFRKKSRWETLSSGNDSLITLTGISLFNRETSH